MANSTAFRMRRWRLSRIILVLAALPISSTFSPAAEGEGHCGISSRVYSAASNFTYSLPNIGAVPGVGLGFANTNEFLSYFLKQLPSDPALDELRREYENASRSAPKIGVTVISVATAEGSRVIVQNTPSPESPAGRAGLQGGDIITAVGNVPVSSSMEVVEHISTATPGAFVTLQISRGDQSLALNVPLPDVADFGRIKEKIRKCLPMVEQPLRLIVDRRRKAVEEAVSEKQKSADREETERRNLEFAQRPDTILGNAYMRYIRLRRCHKERQGYLSIFVSEEELAQARRAVMRLEEKFRGQLGVDGKTGKLWTTETMWERADQLVAGDKIQPYREACQAQLRSLLTAYREHFPQDFHTPKDF